MMSSFADEFSKILTANDFESDDDVDETSARVFTRDDGIAHEVEDVGRSNLRLRGEDALHLIDPKYCGKVVERRDIYSPEIEIESNDEDVSDFGESDDDVDDDGDSDSNECGSEIASDASVEAQQSDGEMDSATTIFQKQKVDSETQARAIKHQMILWDKLMAVRIRMQSVMTHVNKLTPAEKTQPQVRITLKKALTNLFEIEDKIQEKLSSLNGEGSKTTEENDEITSSEDEKKEDETDFKNGNESKTRKRKGIKGIEDDLVKRFKKNKPIRDSIITKWETKTQLSSTNSKHDFSAFGTTVVQQINKICEQKSRLISRTQIDRNADEQTEKNAEIFDDSDFYQQLLRELIESKSSLGTDSSQSARNYALLQKLQKKKRKNVDTKASKARKLRYNIHPKLVNFVTPCDNCTWNPQAVTYLFDSLFSV